MDWTGLAAVTFGGGGVLVPTIALIRWLVKRQQGRLTRASVDYERANRAEKLSERYLRYIFVLRADAISRGERPIPWPRGLRPKDE